MSGFVNCHISAILRVRRTEDRGNRRNDFSFSQLFIKWAHAIHPRSAEVELRGRLAVLDCWSMNLRTTVRNPEPSCADSRLAVTPLRRAEIAAASQLRNLRAMRRMTLVAEERRPRLQQIFRGCAMRVMAV